MKELGDGTIIPNGLTTDPLMTSKQLSRCNFKLMIGQVTKLHYPDDSSSLSKRSIEYDVIAFESNENGSANIHSYFRCRSVDLFGGSNDHIEYTYRADNATTNKEKDHGSMVLLLCINGFTDAGSVVILGGLKNLNTATTHAKADGHFYDFNFNGLEQSIDKDGAFTIKFNSALDINGKQANAAAAGTSIKIDKDGKVIISDNEQQEMVFDRVAKTIKIDNGAEKVVIDKSAKSINIESSGAMSEKSGADMSMESGAAMNMKSSADTSIKSGSNLNIEAGAQGNLKASSGWNIKAGGDVNIQAGGNAVVKASVFTVNAPISMIGQGGVPAALVGISQTLTFLGPIPLPGTILTGSASVLLGV